MRAEIFLAVAVIAGTMLGIRLWERASERPAAIEAVAAYASGADGAVGAEARRTWDREVRIAASHDHQFYVVAGVNRRSAEFLVDTGASFVALRDTDARAAGVFTNPSDFTVPIRTANGETKAALVTLEQIEIDGILVRNVKAFVLPDAQLAVNLLGMSFLSQLESVEARAGELVLRG